LLLLLDFSPSVFLLQGVFLTLDLTGTDDAMPVMDKKESLPLASSAHEASPIDFDLDLEIKDTEGFLEYDAEAPTKSRTTKAEAEAEADRVWARKIAAAMALSNKPYEPPGYLCDKAKLLAYFKEVTCEVPALKSINADGANGIPWDQNQIDGYRRRRRRFPSTMISLGLELTPIGQDVTQSVVGGGSKVLYTAAKAAEIRKRCRQMLKGGYFRDQNCGCKEITDFNEIMPTMVWADGLDLPSSRDVCKEEEAQYNLPKVASGNPYRKPVESGKFCAWMGDPPPEELKVRTQGKGYTDPKAWPCSSVQGKCSTIATPQKCPISDPENPATAYQGACQCLSDAKATESGMVPYTDWLHSLQDDQATSHNLVLYQAQMALNAAALAAVASYGPDMGMAAARKVCVQAAGNIATLPHFSSACLI